MGKMNGTAKGKLNRKPALPIGPKPARQSPDHAMHSVRGLSAATSSVSNLSFSFDGSSQHTTGDSCRNTEIKRNGSSSSEEESLDDWEEIKERRDVLGEILTRMLNEGKVQYFGLPLLEGSTASVLLGKSKVDSHCNKNETFKWRPLLSARNFRVIRGMIIAMVSWIQHQLKGFQQVNIPSEQGLTNGRRHSSAKRKESTDLSEYFLIESFFLFYVTLFSLTDIVVRSISEFFFITLMGSFISLFFDIEEVICAVLLLLDFILPTFAHEMIDNCIDMTFDIVALIERHFLWGFYYQGRTLVWSDEERLIKFRKKHLRQIKINDDRKQNRRDIRKTKAEQRKKEIKGLACDRDDIEKREEEIIVKEALNAAAEELKMNPPTFFPHHIDVNGDPEATLRCNATVEHLASIKYCHDMIFFHEKENDELKPVSITMRTALGNTSHAASIDCLDNCPRSPREAIEVEDEFPDIGTDVSTSGNHVLGAESMSLSDSDFSMGGYDYDGDESTYDADDIDDNASIVSYATESTARSMDWLAVGAKIGHKILNSRQMHRVMTNQEAKKLMNGMNIEKPLENPASPSKASSWEGFTSNKDVSEEVPGLSQSHSIDLPSIKRPVHRMWSNPNAAASSTTPFGVATLNDSLSIQSTSSTESLSLTNCPAHSGESKCERKKVERVAGVLLVPTDQSIELARQSSSNAAQEHPIDPPPDFLGRGAANKLHTRALPKLPMLQNTMDVLNLHPTYPNMRAPAFPRNMKNSSFLPHSEIAEKVLEINPGQVTRLAPIEKGVKIVVPMFPPNVANYSKNLSDSCFFQMGTVVSSSRIFVPNNGAIRTRWHAGKRQTNCLSIRLVLDKALLRGSKFAEMTIRILDEWNYAPRHSKFPIGSCVATTFGLGVLVGWRVKDDFHIIRSLWNRSGAGSGVAYLRRDSIHSVVEAAVGFEVETRMGSGTVLAYVRGGKQNIDGHYFVKLKHNTKYKNRVMEFNRCQILSCHGATFIPVTEHIRAAALYQLEVLHYKAKLREHMLNSPAKSVRDKGMWRNFSEYIDLFVTSFSKAIAEDPDFDREVDKYISHLINFLDGKKDRDEISPPNDFASKNISDNTAIEAQQSSLLDVNASAKMIEYSQGWNVHDMFGFLFIDDKKDAQNRGNDTTFLSRTQAFEEAHETAVILVRVLLRTIAVARASVPNRPKLHIALAMIHEVLLFIRQILRVQKKNMNKKLMDAWYRTLNEIEITFGPLKQRTAALGVKMTKKLRKHGDVAKKRILRFVDIFLGDTHLLHALELGDWKQAIFRFEIAIVKAGITDAATCEQLHKGSMLLYKNLAPRKRDKKSRAAAARNGQKMLKLAKLMKVIASPGRSLLRFLSRDEVLDVFDRILVRIFEKDPICSMMINIYAFNFQTIRHLRTLNNMAIAGKLWETVLDAVDEEVNFAISEIPEQTKYFVDPIVKLFSLGVAKFHRIRANHSTADWLDFLTEDEAVKIIQELDMKFIDSLDAFCKDIKQVFEVLPYIKTIDNDILNLMDELDFDLFFKEITDSIGDSEKFMAYLTDRSALIVERFLDYLPRMSIPIERRELPDGWVLTCRSKQGGDLRLSDISVNRENLVCQVVGSDNVFKPTQGNESLNIQCSSTNLHTESFDSELTDDPVDKDSVLCEVRELILSACKYRCWQVGVGGIREATNFEGVPHILGDLPLSEVLKAGIDLWQSSEITDDELIEIAIRDVSYQIQLQKEREDKGISYFNPTDAAFGKQGRSLASLKKSFNPRVDPTIFYLDIKNLTLHLDEFVFRVEKGEPKTIFDPVFEGGGSLTIKNVSITLRLECRKERVFKNGLETSRPVLELEKLDVRLEKVKMTFKETGADWILNQILKGFSDQITEVVQENLKEQIVKQVHNVLDHVNGFVETNPDLFVRILGITLNDLEERIVCV